MSYKATKPGGLCHILACFLLLIFWTIDAVEKGSKLMLYVSGLAKSIVDPVLCRSCGRNFIPNSRDSKLGDVSKCVC